MAIAFVLYVCVVYKQHPTYLYTLLNTDASLTATTSTTYLDLSIQLESASSAQSSSDNTIFWGFTNLCINQTHTITDNPTPSPTNPPTVQSNECNHFKTRLSDWNLLYDAEKTEFEAHGIDYIQFTSIDNKNGINESDWLLAVETNLFFPTASDAISASTTIDLEVNLLSSHQSCNNGDGIEYNINIGVFETVEECATAAYQNAACNTSRLMWSELYHKRDAWGCRCCTNVQYRKDNENWDLYAFANIATNNLDVSAAPTWLNIEMNGFRTITNSPDSIIQPIMFCFIILIHMMSHIFVFYVQCAFRWIYILCSSF